MKPDCSEGTSDESTSDESTSDESISGSIMSASVVACGISKSISNSISDDMWHETVDCDGN